ncbi:PREDICTED: putative L-aspartate dehydrogenase [Acropora digitifera]|uniref:putative L-aspartate dehydrogenase n=1 Tax=Acropora digitifera TaxID=70779 RepID=UPI000779F414|nr:PREDICTED: putative L-aspartate dehydrogenase [Acropora digitifera]
MISGEKKKRRVGVVGFGHLGQFLVHEILKIEDYELSFVWNRTSTALKGKVDDKYILEDLHSFAERTPDLIIEVAHPSITADYGETFLDVADYMIGSPTAFANLDVENKLRKKASSGRHGIYIPSGALWGGPDIKKMADRGTLQGLKVTMKKHPSCYKLNEPLKTRNDQVKSDAVVLYDGKFLTRVLQVTVIILILFVKYCSLEAHIVEVDVIGPGQNENLFTVKTIRHNPAVPGAVTGNATYASFLSSMLGETLYFSIAMLNTIVFVMVATL